ncbi:hypothetical protein ACX0GZ_12640 [Sphingomonas aestuarii]
MAAAGEGDGAVKVRPFSATGYIDDSLSNEQSKEVMANFGLAVHASCVVEYAVLNALFMVEIFPRIRSYSNKAAWEQAYDEFYDEGFSQTFGKLVRRLKSSGKFSPDLSEILDACTIVRNNLVHHVQRDKAADIFSASGRAELIELYENSVSLFEAAND